MGSVALYDALARAARRPGSRTWPSAPGRWRCSTTWCRRSASPATRCVFAWRSFEAYPIADGRLRRPVGARCRSPRTAVTTSTAMAAAITDRTRIVLVCTPEQPHGAGGDHAELEAFLRRVPSDVVVVVDEAYREFVRSDDPLDALALLPRPAATSRCCGPSRRPTAWPGCGSATWSRPSQVAAAVRRARCRSGSRPSRRPPRSPRSGARRLWPSASRRSSPSATGSPRRCASRAGRCRTPQGNFVWLRPRRADTPRFAAAAEARGIMVRPYATDGVRVTDRRARRQRRVPRGRRGLRPQGLTAGRRAGSELAVPALAAGEPRRPVERRRRPATPCRARSSLASAASSDRPLLVQQRQPVLAHRRRREPR